MTVQLSSDLGLDVSEGFAFLPSSDKSLDKTILNCILFSQTDFSCALAAFLHISNYSCIVLELWSLQKKHFLAR